jgi:thymidylate kinase
MNLPAEFVENLYKKLRDPDYTFILLGSSHKHDAEDVYESDNELQKNVRDLYANWSTQHPGRSLVIDCSKPRDVISQEIITALHEASLL